MAKGSSLNRKEMIKEEILDITKEERTMEREKIWVNRIDFPFPFKFSKLCLVVEAPIITVHAVVLNVCGRNI